MATILRQTTYHDGSSRIKGDVGIYRYQAKIVSGNTDGINDGPITRLWMGVNGIPVFDFNSGRTVERNVSWLLQNDLAAYEAYKELVDFLTAL